MKSKISLLTLGVTDLQRSIDFYHKGLGFQFHNYTEGDDHVMFVMEGTWISLYPKDRMQDEVGVKAAEGKYSRVVMAHNVASKEEVDKVHQLALDAGAEELAAPADAFWGGYTSHFADPDGYIWSAAYNPFTDLS